jgi:membrane protein required for beta-lactamase induction
MDIFSALGWPVVALIEFLMRVVGNVHCDAAFIGWQTSLD